MIPYSTDAPLYHLPFGTVGMIVLNVVCFFAFCFNLDVGQRSVRTDQSEFNGFGEKLFEDFIREDGEADNPADPQLDVEKLSDRIDALIAQERVRYPLLLHYGVIRPWQWFTSFFMHADFFHLAGNMIFLWAFGLIVEGKIGWWRFLLLYIGIGVGECAVEQFLMLFSCGMSLGASSAIFGLLAVVVLWAPKNEFTVFIHFWYPAVEIPIVVYGGLYLLIEFAFGAWGFSQGDGFGSQALHLLGFAVGLPVGFIMLKNAWVDCEGFDLISVYGGKIGKKSKIQKEYDRKSKQRRVAARQAQSGGEKIEPSVSQKDLLRQQYAAAISEQNYRVALKLREKLSAMTAFPWEQLELQQIVRGLIADKEFELAAPLMKSHIELFEAHRSVLTVQYLKVLLHLNQPSTLLRYVKTLDATQYDMAQRTTIKQAVVAAKEQIANRVVELR